MDCAVYDLKSADPMYIPEVSVESVLQHPSVKKGQKGFEEIKD